MSAIDTGLDGVPVCTSDISQTTLGTDGNPVLIYRGYSIYDLVKGSFEESVYLLLSGELPTKAQLADLARTLAEH
jgi:citrate synthase